MPSRPATASWLERPWGRMRVWRAGRGPLVLAVHGLGGSGRYWRGLANRVGDRVTIVAPDLPGFGASDRPTDDIDRTMLLGELDAVAAAADVGGPIHVVGHSLGGVLAFLWASEQEGLASIALAAPPFPHGSRMDLRSRADLRPSAGRRFAARATRAIWPALAVPIGLSRGYPPAVVIDFGRQSVRARAWTMWSLWSDPGLGGIVSARARTMRSVPVQLAQARDDRTVSFDAHRAWASLLPGAESHELDEGGHQFLLRTGFEPIAGWLAREAVGG